MDQLGRFVIRGELGRGRHSVVYEARDGGKACALRVINDASAPSDAAHRSGVAAGLAGLARVEHPSVVRAFEGGELDGKLYVAMELMGCPTLEAKLAAAHRLDEKQVVLFVRQAAQALDKARDLGYFHGDLRAGSVFVVSEEKVKLSGFAVTAMLEHAELAAPFAASGRGEEDFGLSNMEWVTAEELLRAKGQASGKPLLDEDFTALGVLMMQMFGVSVPAQGSQLLADYRASLVSGPLGRLSGLQGGVGGQTVEVVRRLLTPGGFDSPGEVVVELASAMLLRRPFARGETQPPPVSAETAAVSMQAPPPESMTVRREATGLENLEFVGDPRTAAFTPFFVWESRRGGRFFLVHDGERITIGRDPDCSDIALMDPALSRRHCIMSRRGGTIWIEDLDSTNGTFANEQRVQSAEIRPGDTVRIGATKMFMTLPARER